MLEDNLRALEVKQGTDAISVALSSVRSAIQKPESVYDPYKASAHVEAKTCSS